MLPSNWMKQIGQATGQIQRSQTKITKRTQSGPVFSTKPKDESQFPTDLLLIGNQGGTNVGWSLYQACTPLGLTAHFADALQAAAAPAWKRRISWRLLGHRPVHLATFSNQVLTLCQNLRPPCLLATGFAPITRPTLQAIGNLGITRLNYLTDDPWNPSFRARWFLEALPMYDTVFSARRANIPDLENLGCRTVRYLP